MIKIKNWSKFQHFKDRRPPWIKVHREILDQRDISLISDRSFRVLVGLWLLASEDSEMEGALPSIDDIAFRLRLKKDIVISCLDELNDFLIRDDIKPLSIRYQSDDPETETETETEADNMSGKPDHKAASKEILLFLNEKTGRNYQPVIANLEMIQARLKEGFTEIQLRQVIAKKTRDWGKDEKMNQYLRPKTLFSRTNFAQYAGELGASQ